MIVLSLYRPQYRVGIEVSYLRNNILGGNKVIRRTDV